MDDFQDDPHEPDEHQRQTDHPDDGQDTETLLKHADADMYARKQATDVRPD